MLFDLSLQIHASTFILNACIRNPIINKLCSALRSVKSIFFFHLVCSIVQLLDVVFRRVL
jgi:hypothetical protein